MKLIFAPDSFKGSLSALEITDILASVAHEHFPDAELHSMPIADGGEGTVDALLRAGGGTRRTRTVVGPMGAPVEATYGVLADGRTAVIEMAQASGLPLVPDGARNPLKASSEGTGELIRAALDEGMTRLLVGIGGSATNDGGMGMLTALGAKFLDEGGALLPGRGEDLANVRSVDLSGLHPALNKIAIEVICDVTNPLLGPTGAVAVYGPQKGVTPDIAPLLEAGMANYARVLEATLGRAVAAQPGAGAAGGMGAALGAVLGGTLRSGIDAVLDTVGFDDMLVGCDLVVTGEGCLDRQSVAYGKVPTGVAKRCRMRDVPVLAIVGSMGLGAEAFYALGRTSIVTTVNGVMTLSDAMQGARALYEDAAQRAFRLIKMGMGMKP